MMEKNHLSSLTWKSKKEPVFDRKFCLNGQEIDQKQGLVITSPPSQSEQKFDIVAVEYGIDVETDEIKEKIDNIEKYRPFSEREDEICAPECVLFIEDKNFFNRGNRYTFFNRFYLQDSYRRKLKKLFFRFLRSENKTNCIDKALRGYSTIERFL